MKKITPHLWFDKEAVVAAEFYVSVFPGSKFINSTTLHDTPSGDTQVVSFELSGQPFMAISAGPLFKFNEAVSFVIACVDQKEIDYFWEKLSAVPEAEQCGWLKDKFGVHWQVIPSALGKLMRDKDPAKSQRVMQAMMKMVKIDVAGLEAAHRGA